MIKLLTSGQATVAEGNCSEEHNTFNNMSFFLCQIYYTRVVYCLEIKNVFFCDMYITNGNTIPGGWLLMGVNIFKISRVKSLRCGVTSCFQFVSVHHCRNDFSFSSRKRLCLTIDIWDKEIIGLDKCIGWCFRDLDQRTTDVALINTNLRIWR